MNERTFLLKCQEAHCDFILKGVTASIDSNKYWIYGIKNGYCTRILPVNYYGQYPLFDKLNYRQYYPLEDLMRGEQLQLL